MLQKTTLGDSGLMAEMTNEISNSQLEEDNEENKEKLINDDSVISDNAASGENKESFFAIGNEGSSMIQGIAMTFGLGILNYPSLIYKAGFVPSLIMFILCSAAQQYTLNLLVSGALNLKHFDYYELTLKTKGIHWARAYAIFSTAFILFTIVEYNEAMIEYIKHIYLVIKRKNMSERFVCLLEEGATESDLAGLTFQLVTLAILTVIEIGMVFYKSAAKVYNLSVVIVGFITLTGLIIIIECPIFYFNEVKDIFKVSNKDPKIDTGISFFNYFFTYCGCIMMYLFSYFNHFGFLFIVSRQKDQTEESVSKVMRYSFIYEAVAYFIIGFVGYFGLSTSCVKSDFGYITRDDGWGSNPRKEDYGLFICKIIYIISMLCLISVRLELVEEIIKHFFEDAEKFAKIEYYWKSGLILAMSLITVLLNVIKNRISQGASLMNNLIEIFNALVGVVISFYIPLFIFHSIYGRKRRRSKIGYVCFIFFLSISICTVINTILFSFKN
ncbi:MAG: amino acid transporter [archaeon]|nr:amino acid transporter [archaeon]